MLSILHAHFTLHGGFSGGGFHAFIVESNRKPGALRFAYRLNSGPRWKISGITPHGAATVLLDMLKRDMARGTGFKPFLHRVKVAHREQIPTRFKIHRKALRARLEEDAIKHLSNFGMF